MVAGDRWLVFHPLRKERILGQDQILSELLPVEDVRQIQLPDLNPQDFGAKGLHPHSSDVGRGLSTDNASRCFRRAFESNKDFFAERLHTILRA